MKVRSMLPTLWGESASERVPFRTLQQEVDKLFNDFGSDLPVVGRWNGIGRLAMQVDVLLNSHLICLAGAVIIPIRNSLIEKGNLHHL